MRFSYLIGDVPVKVYTQDDTINSVKFFDSEYDLSVSGNSGVYSGFISPLFIQKVPSNLSFQGQAGTYICPLLISINDWDRWKSFLFISMVVNDKTCEFTPVKLGSGDGK